MLVKSLCFPINKEKGIIYLGEKKVRFGKGKLNGFGGGFEKKDGTIYRTAIRELEEESGLRGLEENLIKHAEIDFFFPESKAKEWNQKVHVFLIYDWKGEPKESDEMTIEEHPLKSLPYYKMWNDDKYWLPEVLKGRKIKSEFYFNEDCETTKLYKIRWVDNFD